MTAKLTKGPWPKLSEPGLFPVSPVACLTCGSAVTDADESGPHARRRWVEHDDYDRPTDALVVLCQPCSDARIERHPRLYSRVEPNKPVLGAMELCADCTWREGLRCRNPDAKANGGIGLAVAVERPFRGFMDGVVNGRRAGWRIESWPSAPRACEGFRHA